MTGRIGVIWLVATLVLLAATTSAPVAAQEVVWCGEIRSNTTWAAGTVHRVCSGGVRVRLSTLTIAPGADILMDDGASLVIESGAGLSAVGAQDAGIRFRANTRDEAPGFWGQILFEAGAEPSVLAAAEVRHGGKGNVPMIEVQSDVVEMTGLLLQGAQDVPLAFRANGLGPSLDAAGNVTQGGACRNIVIRNNNVDGIRVIADAAVDVVDSQVWHNFCVPYLVTDDVAIGGELNPDLHLDVGVQVQLGGDGGFTAGVDADHPGEFLSDGTPSEPIKLTSMNNVTGGWAGINLTEYSGFSSLNNTVVEQGGGGDRPMVVVRSAKATTIGSSFHNALGYPLSLVPAAVGPFLGGIFYAGDEVNAAFVGNGIQRILVLSAEDPVLTRGALWGDAGVPLEMDGDLIVAGDDIPKLQLDPGAELAFRPNRRLVIGDDRYGPAEIDSLGTEAKPVVITGTEARSGSWGGMVVGDAAITARLDYTVVEWGGSPTSAMLEWSRVEGDIARSTFRGAVTYPISMPVSIASDVILDPDVTTSEGSEDLRSTFEGNGVNRVLLTADRTVRDTLTQWHDPGAPVEIDGLVTVSAPSMAVLSVSPGISLLFRSGAGLRLGDGQLGRGSLSVNPGADAVVSLGAVEPLAGWQGITVLDNSSVDVGGSFSIREISESGAAFAIDGGALVLRDAEAIGAKRGTGIAVTGGGTAVVADSTVTDWRIGLHAREGGSIDIRRSTVQGNSEWGFLNETADGPCLTAELVYWGAPLGPNDGSDAVDGCVNAKNDSPDGDRVSDFVNWWPYAVDTAFTPSSGLGPNPKKAYIPYIVRGN